MTQGWAVWPGKGSPTCFSEWEVVFGIVHPQDWVVVGAGDAALGWGALVQRAVLGLPAQEEREEGTSFTPVTQRGPACHLREWGRGQRQSCEPPGQPGSCSIFQEQRGEDALSFSKCSFLSSAFGVLQEGHSQKYHPQSLPFSSWALLKKTPLKSNT